MLEVLNIPEFKNFVAPITIDRYHQMIDSGVFDGWEVELLNGVLVQKMSKSELHYFLVKYLEQALQTFCPASEFLIGKEDPITIGNSEPEPDISVIKGQLKDFRHAKPTTALFVCEVAISSLTVDRAKRVEYAKAGIPEYWIVRPEASITEVYLEPVDGNYAQQIDYPADQPIHATALPGFVFSLSEALKG